MSEIPNLDKVLVWPSQLDDADVDIHKYVHRQPDLIVDILLSRALSDETIKKFRGECGVD